MVLVSKSPLQDFVLGVGAQLGRDQNQPVNFQQVPTTPTLVLRRHAVVINKVHKLKRFKVEVLQNQTKHSPK